MASSERRVVQPGDINELASQLNDIAANWELFVGQLGVPYAKQQQISVKRNNHPSCAQICLVDGLHHWVTSDPSPTIEKVIAVLRSHAIDDQMLAGRIDKEWKVTVTPVVEEPVPVEQTDSCTAASQATTAEPEAKRCYSVDQAKMESKQLQDDFIALVTEMKSHLKSSVTDAGFPEFHDQFILKIPISIKDDNEKFFTERNTKILKTTTFDELFYLLNIHWNYLNHSLLQGFSSAYGTAEYKRKLEAFTAAVAEFEEMITIEVFKELELQPRVDPPPEFEEFVTTHKLSLQSTLADLEHIRHKFCEKFHLHTFAFYLVRVLKGSVIITWLVPHSVARRLEAEMTKDLIKEAHIEDSYADKSSKENVKWEEIELQGDKIYEALGDRDVLLIGSEACNLPETIAHTAPSQLSREERAGLLTCQGVPPDCPLDDLQIMRARYNLDKRQQFKVVGVEQSTSERPLTTSYVKSRIKELFRTTKKPGVILYYHGPGRKDTGDWFFADGFITFQDIADLYTKHFKWSLLIIHTDCSYSGSWVKSCGEFLDKQGVQPCGHSARDKGILIKLHASCRANEVAQSLHYSTRILQNDKNTKSLYNEFSKPSDPQHCVRLHSTTIRCANKAIEQPCTLPPDLTWEKQLAKDEVSKRVFLVRGEDGGRPAWHYVLLVDDEETIRAFHKKMQGDNTGKSSIELTDYGKILKSGFGEAPTQEEARKWLSILDYTTLM